jgi:hypothetical protein
MNCGSLRLKLRLIRYYETLGGRVKTLSKLQILEPFIITSLRSQWLLCKPLIQKLSILLTQFIYVFHGIISTKATISLKTNQQICLCNGDCVLFGVGTDYLKIFSLRIDGTCYLLSNRGKS